MGLTKYEYLGWMIGEHIKHYTANGHVEKISSFIGGNFDVPAEKVKELIEAKKRGCLEEKIGEIFKKGTVDTTFTYPCVHEAIKNYFENNDYKKRLETAKEHIETMEKEE